MIEIYIVILFSIIIGFFFKSQIENILISCNMIQLNYKNELIPIGMGLYYIPSIIFLSFFLKEYDNITTNLIIIGILTMAFVGFIDDSTTDKLNKGIKGHIKQLFKLKLSTGMLKAISGFGISIYISSFISKNAIDFLINIFLLSLFTNFMNLWDLRPGRASKVFILISLFLFIISNLIFKFYLLLMIVLTLIYIKGDLKARYMLGDTGSNMLGMFLGIVSVYNMDIKIKIVCLIFLFSINLFAEKYSLSKIIQNNKILNYFDLIGR